MHTSTTPDINRALQPAPRFRELTPAETDHVSGGIIPIIVAAAVVAVAVLELSDDSSEGGEQDDD